jgi:hypothetical protein
VGTGDVWKPAELAQRWTTSEASSCGVWRSNRIREAFKAGREWRGSTEALVRHERGANPAVESGPDARGSAPSIGLRPPIESRGGWCERCSLRERQEAHRRDRAPGGGRRSRDLRHVATLGPTSGSDTPREVGKPEGRDHRSRSSQNVQWPVSAPLIDKLMSIIPARSKSRPRSGTVAGKYTGSPGRS